VTEIEPAAASASQAAPGTEGETGTIDDLVETFRGLGLEPGGANGSFTQGVPLLRTQIETPPGGWRQQR